MRIGVDVLHAVSCEAVTRLLALDVIKLPLASGENARSVFRSVSLPLRTLPA